MIRTLPLLAVLPLAACGNAPAGESVAECVTDVEPFLSISVTRIEQQIAAIDAQTGRHKELDAIAKDRAQSAGTESGPDYAQAMGQLRARLEQVAPQELDLFGELMVELEGFESRATLALRDCPEAAPMIDRYRRQIPLRAQTK